MVRSLLTLTALLPLLAHCAEPRSRVWIEPPIGYAAQIPKKLYYKVEGGDGNKETLAIPLTQLPQDLVVEGVSKIAKGELGPNATRADQLFSQGKVSDAKPTAPTLSYFRGVQAVERLHAAGQFSEALIRLTPLLEQYNDQAKLFQMQGTLYRKLGERKMALLAFKRAQEIEKTNPALDEAIQRTQEELEDHE